MHNRTAFRRLAVRMIRMAVFLLDWRPATQNFARIKLITENL